MYKMAFHEIFKKRGKKKMYSQNHTVSQHGHNRNSVFIPGGETTIKATWK